MWQGIFFLCYTQHGGSGLGLTLTEVLDLDYQRFLWLQERLDEQRGKEADALKKAAKRRRK